MTPTLYDILGVSAHASDTELRRAYYRAARRLHPDVNPDLDSDAMRQLNQAWAVLGAPASRHAYDRALLDRAAGQNPPAPEDPDTATGRSVGGAGDLGIAPLARVLRPSVVIIAVLVVIFLVTAYAGPGPGPADRIGPTVAPTPTPAAAPGSPAAGVPVGVVAGGTSVARLVGQCLEILPSYLAVVPCTTANDGRVVAGAASVDECPAGARAYRLPGQGQIVCLEPVGG